MKSSNAIALLSLIVPTIAAPDVAGLDDQPLIKLKPQVTRSRDLVNLDGLWKFALATSPNETTTPWTAPLSTDLECPVPASYNDVFLSHEIRNHVGWVYYQRDVTVPKGWSMEERYLVRADAATHEGRIYVNNDLVAEHVGGYTPFEADVTDRVIAGEKFRLTIAVNNELTNTTIPPGEIFVEERTGVRKQEYGHDFFNYAGLARLVWLYSVPRQHIQDITVVTDVEDDVGIITYDIVQANVGTGQIEVAVFDEQGAVVANASGAQGTVRIPSINLWQPGAGYLYQFEASIVSDGTAIDVYTVATGVRTVRVEGSQFLINGSPFYFTGFGRHEDSEVRGRGHDPAYMVHDFELMNWVGANSFRTSHYPYAEDVMEYADRKGIVVIDETAAVGLNLGISAGLGEEAEPTFGPNGGLGNQTARNHVRAIRELISRDKNHAGVVMWSIANEPPATEEDSLAYFAPLARLTHDLDSSRPMTVVMASANVSQPEGNTIASLLDVVCLNRYYGWYDTTGDPELAELGLETELRGWQKMYDKPIIMTEYGVDTIVGLHEVRGLP